MPGAPGQTVSSISNTAVNQVGGYAATANTTDGVTTLSRIWGHPTGGAGSVLWTETTVGNLEQTGLESFFGLSDAGVVAYSALVNDTQSQLTSLDTAWLNGAPIAVEGEPIAGLPGKLWRFASRVGVTGDGQPYWVGGIDDAQSGANEGNGLFLGVGATCLYKTGDVIGSLPPLGSSAIDFDVRVSALGNHHILVVDTTGPTNNDAFVVLDGAVLNLGGSDVGQGEPVAAAIGGLPGESWSSIGFLGVTESGSYLLTADTDAGFSEDQVVVRDGAIVYREGQTLDGHVLSGAIEGAYMNEAGDVAFVWDVEDGSGGFLEALYLDQQLLLREGDAVDLDGDGVVDPGAVISNFTGLSAVTLGPQRTVYFTADVDTQGTSSSLDDVECFFALEPASLAVDAATLSVTAGGTATFDIAHGRAFAGDLQFLLGSFSGTSPGLPLAGVLVPLNLDDYLLLTLQQPNSALHVGTFGPLDAAGRATAQLVLPPGSPAGLIGLTSSHSDCVIDAGSFALVLATDPVATSFVP